MTTKTKPAPLGVPEGFAWESITVGDTEYIIRELRVKEDDAAWDASLDEKNVANQRLYGRLSLAAAIVSPATTVGDLDDWGGTKLLAVTMAFNRVNTLEPAAPAEGESPNS